MKSSSLEACASKRVSFIITTKNRAEYLRKAFENHRKLIHPEDELIVIDGLSTDNTLEVVKQYASIVDALVSEPDFSGAHALNKGILIAHGKYIKQLADDDEYYPEAMEKAIRVMKEHPEVDLLLCGGTRRKNNRISNVYVPPGKNYGEKVENVFIYGACGTGFLIRRSSLSRIGLLHPRDIAADKELVLRAIKCGANVKFCRINLFDHSIYEHSVTVRQQRESERDSNRLLKQYCPLDFRIRYRLSRLKTKKVDNIMAWLTGHPRLAAPLKALRDSLKKTEAKTGPGTTVFQQQEQTASDVKWDRGFS